MKKKVNIVIMALMLVVMIWGIIASCLTLATLNAKDQRATYDKNGKYITTSDVSEENKYIYVKKLNIEMITRVEHYRRIAKNSKIVMKKAKETYEADKTETKMIAYNQAKANYDSALSNVRTYRRTIFTNSSAVFFGTYFPVVILLGIFFLINQKIDYKREK